MLEIKECVIQEDDYGCLAACVATILQLSYKEVSGWFATDLSKECTNKIHNVNNHLASYGIDTFYLENSYYCNPTRHFELMLKPFADIHIITAQMYIETPEVGHAMILTKEGLILNPSTGKEFDGAILAVNYNCGYFYPANWAFPTGKGESNVVDNCSNRTRIGDFKPFT